ncbi:MAG: tRNA guanosine(34) transglycosylase Tgt [Gemmatimonadales bacterium]|nr:tRNA guanosine(34) transglycosylase Tgt [Gemmatimonadales bacterium]
MSFTYTLEATEGAARAGTLVLPHGVVRTPAFMPVGTHGVVRGLDPQDVRDANAQIILANTYHLHLRPGEATVRALGGLHRFTTWERPMLTDSGGFQVFSLEGMRTISEEGVAFTSHVDGSRRFLSPERSMEVQWTLGADIAMVFDHVPPGQAPHALAREAMERTERWLDRGRKRHAELVAEGLPGPDGVPQQQALWPIVQGGIHDDLRLRSLAGIVDRGPWTGIAVGGLSVGESKPDMHRVLELLEPHLPREVPRYLMGVGFPEDLLEGIARGIDLFDCVAATRNGRHGTAWVTEGRMNVKLSANRTSDLPLDPGCDCTCCTRFSRGYVRHLFMAEDMLGLRLVSVHNIRFLLRLGEQARAHILAGTFDGWRREWLRVHATRRGRPT